MDPLTQLQALGFSEYEARAYVTLLKRSPLNGYELAKDSGLPRANVYAVLQKLEERGAVLRLDAPGGVRYAPVPPDEFTRRLQSRFTRTLDSTRQALAGMAGPAEREHVWNAEGYPALLEHARALLDATRERLLVAVHPPEAQALAPELAQAQGRGVGITTLCLEACPGECGNCRGRIYRYAVAPEQAARWLVVVSDEAEMLAGEIGPGDQAQTVRTRQRLIVNLAAWYTRHSIALAAVVSDLGGRLERLLQPATRAILKSLGPVPQGPGWLEHMRRLLKSGARPSAN